MKPIAIALVAAIIAAAGGGCRNTAVIAEQTRSAYTDYVHQPRTYGALVIEGSNMTVAISGLTTMRMEAPLNPLGAMPKDPDSVRAWGDLIKNTLLGLMGIHTLGRVATQGPTIVTQPQPLVVHPTVIQP